MLSQAVGRGVNGDRGDPGEQSFRLGHDLAERYRRIAAELQAVLRELTMLACVQADGEVVSPGVQVLRSHLDQRRPGATPAVQLSP
ncbi:hypothetical protein ACH4TQ_42790 [Streptomyces sp. NPDC021218]|uniref:hypothetical protein n=1 Tax=Streptomyces sp. NPDC021218 TaxID=3365119 RepID=UPI003793EA0F